MKKLQSRGFTIIELLIATVTFSLILLVITGAIIQFSKIYYKGVATSKTQEVARSIADEISRSAQFSTVFNSPLQTPTGGVYCFGDKRYSYTLNELSPAQAVLVTDTSTNCIKDMTLGPDDRELIGENMQLLRLGITESGDQITVEVTVGYGDDGNMNNPNSSTANCKQLTLGGQFCVVSTVKSIVTRRL